jgi:heme exporter protein B
MITIFIRQITREMLLHARQPRWIFNACLFFLMVAVFFPLTMPPQTVLLRTIAPGIVWIAMLLAMLLSAERLFQQDYDEGVIEQWLVSIYPISLLVSAKCFVHWFLIMLPILLFCPFLAILFGLNGYETLVLMLSLLCGSPALLFLCGLGAAFSTSLQQKGMLMALILLPLTVPVVIFGAGMTMVAMKGLPINGYMALLMAISLIAISFLPFAIAGVIRLSLSES